MEQAFVAPALERAATQSARAEALGGSDVRRIDVVGTALVVLAGATALVGSAVHYLL